MHTFPINQTSYSVQLDQVLTTLQGDVRADLQTFLEPARQRAHQVRRRGGIPRALPDLAALVQVHLAGQPGGARDPARRPLGRRSAASTGSSGRSARNEQTLQGLVTNFRIVTGSFAAAGPGARRGDSGRCPTCSTSAEPAFANLNASFPPVRAFAREALPGVRSTPATLDASTPFVEQVRALVSEARAARPDRRPAPDDPEARQARRSQRRVLRPGARPLELLQRGRDPVVGGHRAAGRSRPNQYPSRAGRAGVRGDRPTASRGSRSESRSGDANGQYIRVAAGGGTNTVKIPERAAEPDRRRAPGRGRPDGLPDPRRDAEADRLGEDAVQAEHAVRAPGSRRTSQAGRRARPRRRRARRSRRRRQVLSQRDPQRDPQAGRELRASRRAQSKPLIEAGGGGNDGPRSASTCGTSSPSRR